MDIHECTRTARTDKHMHVHTSLKTEGVFTGFKALMSQKLISLEASVTVVLSWEYSHTRTHNCLSIKLMELGQWRSMNGQCDYSTWDHAVQALDVLLGNAALRANFVNEARNKPDHWIGHVAVLGVLEPALSVEALCNAAGDAAKHTRKGGSSSDGIQYVVQFGFGDLTCWQKWDWEW